MCPALDMRLMTGQVVRFYLISKLSETGRVKSNPTEGLCPLSG